MVLARLRTGLAPVFCFLDETRRSESHGSRVGEIPVPVGLAQEVFAWAKKTP